jgi:nitrogen regulatory protein P-II 2
MNQPMKLVTASIRPYKIDDVIAALACIGMRDVSVTENRDYSQKGDRQIYRGMDCTPRFLSMLKLEVIVPEDHVKAVVDLIGSAAQTGQRGDGKIVVSGIELEVSTSNAKSPTSLVL